jgi:hypothetical protein
MLPRSRLKHLCEAEQELTDEARRQHQQARSKRDRKHGHVNTTRSQIARG